LRKHLALAVLLAAVACGRPPVRDEVTIELTGEDAIVTAQTSFDLESKNAEVRTRLEAARGAALAGTDPWSARFGRLTAQTEQLTFHRTNGVLDRMTRIARIPREDLQRFFSDASLTVSIVDGDGWSELTIYPGASTRATREQREHFTRSMSSWSGEVARYFTALSHVYQYLDGAPQRAPYVFAALLNEKRSDGTDPALLEDEQPMIDTVLEAMEEIGQRMDVEEGRALSFAEEADLVFNPLPATLTIRTDGAIESAEGFRETGGALVIEPIDLFATIAELEGRWVSPDPLTALLRDEVPTAEQLAKLPRKSTPFVSGTEIETALREKLVRPARYVVRWRGR
jgi:hypothetical protein